MGGWTSNNLLDALKNDQNYRNSVTSADLITLFIGVNDFGLGHFWYYYPPQMCPPATCMQGMTGTFKGNYDQIISEIRALNPQAPVRVMTIFNPFVTEDINNGVFNYFNGFLQEMNSHIRQVAQANNLPLIDTNALINGPTFNQDGVANGYLLAPVTSHPNTVGNVAIADLLRGLGYQDFDLDNDDIADNIDNCPGVSNPNQANFNKEVTDLSGFNFDDVTNPTGDNEGDACDDDIDNDWLPNSQETNTNPSNSDTDGDNFLDGAEVRCGSNPTVAASTPKKPYPNNPSYTAPDSDNDGLPNSCEAAFGSDPNNKDSDADKFADGVEALYKGTDPANVDSDADGCSDTIESASINGDKVVNSADQLLIAQTFNKRIGQSGYNKAFDVNGDGVINSLDQLIQAGVFNQRCN